MEMYNLTTALEYAGILPESVYVDRGQVWFTEGNRVADTSRWKQPPHVALANLDLGRPAAIADFVKAYGISWMGFNPEEIIVSGSGQICNLPPSYSAEDALLTRIELAGKKTQPAQFHVQGQDLAAFQNPLRLAWRGDRSAFLKLEKKAIGPFGIRKGKQIFIWTADLWKFTALLFLIDHADKRTRICARTECDAPYFVQRRKDQLFCSHRCASFTSVDVFRERQRARRRK